MTGRLILKSAVLGAVATLVVVIALLLSLPLLLDSELVKAAALKQLSRATGGQWQLTHLQLRWLPRPTIRAAGASFSLPGTIEGRVETVTLTTALLPLLWGEIRLGHVALVGPDLTITVASPSASGGGSPPFTVSELRAALARLPRPGAVDPGSLELAIARGRLALVLSDQTGLKLSDIEGRATERAGRLEVAITSASDVWRRLEARISLDPGRFEGGVQLDAAGVDLAALLAVAGANGDPPLRGLISGRAKIQIVPAPALRGTFAASAGTLSVIRGGGRLEIQDLASAGEAEWTDAGLRVVTPHTRAAAPALQGSAVLTFSPDWTRQGLDVTMQPTGLDTVKQVVLPWLTATPEVERYARMIKAGQLSGLEATLQLDQLEQWQRAIAVRGTLAGVALDLPRPALAIRDLGATLALRQGKLTAERVRAVTGQSTIGGGRLEVDFAAARPGVSAAAQWRIDLGEALAFVRRQLAAREREKLGMLRALAGEARGTVSLNGTFDALRLLAGADTIRAQAALDPLPWPIKVTDAKAHFEGGRLVVQGLTGTAGGSGFSQCGGQVTLAAPSRLQVSRCEADLALVELFEWGSTRWRTPEALKSLRVLAGRGRLQIHKIAGALEDPATWSTDVSLTPQTIRLSHRELPGELLLDGGSVRSDFGAITVQGVKAEVLDAALQVSGAVSGLREGTPRLDMRATGRVGEKSIAWGWARAGLAGETATIAPFEARGARLRWPTNGGVEAAGELLFAGKTTVSFDALMQPGVVDIHTLDVQDEQSNARIAMYRRHDMVEGSFAGNLAGISLERIVRATQLAETRLAGNLTYRVPLKQPHDFRANGELRIDRLTSPGWGLLPFHMTVHRADVKAADRSLHLITSFSAQDTNLDVSGTIRGSDQRYAVDIDVKSDTVDVDRLLAARDREGGPGSEERPTSWDFPVEGKVRLAIQSLQRSPYHVEPLRAALDIAPDRVDFAVQEARVCGIGMTGGGRAQPRTLSIDVVLQARDLDSQSTLRCLTRESIAMTGRLQADAHLTAAAGPYRGLPQRMQGPFHLVARQGRVDRMTALADILNLVNASELLRGKKLGLRGSGFEYDMLEAKGRLDRGTIQFDEMVLDAQPFDMVARGSVDLVEDSVDMNVAVAPVQAVNTALKWLPFLGYVLGGGVYAVPVGVRGKLSKPQIVPVAPTAVADELRGILGRTLKVPFNLREALVPPALETEPASPPPPR